MSITRRRLLQSAGIGAASALAAPVLGARPLGAGWAPALAAALSQVSERRHCVLLWMAGGPSQTDTFDMKLGHANGGPFRETATKAAGLRFSEHLPQLAKRADQLAVIRSLSTKEGDHARGTYLMRTGHPPGEPIKYPTLGSVVSKELGLGSDKLPSYVSIASSGAFNSQAYQPGFLGPKHAALAVRARNPVIAANQPNENQDENDNEQEEAVPRFTELGVDDLQAGAEVAPQQLQQRLGLLRFLQDDFVDPQHGGAAISHNTALERALRMMSGKSAEAFDLSRESDKVRQAYGVGAFGQGCLLARRLIERGVSFVEVTLGDFGRWDTHTDNFRIVKNLSAELDAGWATLMSDLAERGLLERTTILWMGEFGRTPRINGAAGRDHFPRAWSSVLAGGGIRGGQAIGRTSASGGTVEEGQVAVGDVLATLCRALEIDPRKQNISEMGRPIRIADGTPIKAALS